MATSATVPMFAPDGTTTGEIPQGKVQDALKAGFRPAFEMTAPDGSVGYIPKERAQDALKAGFKLGAPDQPDHPGNRYWEALTNPVGSGGREQGLLGGVLQVGGQAIKTIAAPFTDPKGTLQGIVKTAIAASSGNPYTMGSAIAQPLAEQAQADTQRGGRALAGENIAGQILGTIEGGRALGAVPKAAGAAAKVPIVADAIDTVASKVLPSAMKEKAAGLLQSVAHDANKIPVQLDNAGDSALKLMDWQRKTQLGPTVNKFLNRITNPKAGPLTYEEARDFYQLLGKMSVDETLKMAPPVRAELTRMVVGLKQDIGNAADQVGQAANYYQGLKDYAKGAKLQEFYDTAKDFLAKKAIPAALGGGGLATAWHLYNQNR